MTNLLGPKVRRAQILKQALKRRQRAALGGRNQGRAQHGIQLIVDDLPAGRVFERVKNLDI